MKVAVRTFFPVVLFAIIICTNAFAQTVPFPQLIAARPQAIQYTPDNTWLMVFSGSNMRPAASAFGTNDFTLNTNPDKYHYFAMQVVTTHGQTTPIVHCNVNSLHTNGCKLDNWGPDTETIEVIPGDFTGWNDGSELIISYHLVFPGPNGGRDVSSNELHIPFIRTFAGPPILDSVAPSTFMSTTNNWQVQLQGRMIDKTIFVKFNDEDADPLASPSIDANGAGSFSAVIPPTARGRGVHDVKLCRVLVDYTGRSSELCGSPQKYTVNMLIERQGIASPVANNLRINPSVIAELAPELVTVTCASTPLYVDLQLNPLTSAGKPMYAKAGQNYHAARSTVRGANGKQLRSLSDSGTSYIDAACVK